MKILLALVLLASTALGQTPQDLVDAAPAGSVVYMPRTDLPVSRLVVRKPLTIVGDDNGLPVVRLSLEGPGAGRVNLVRVFFYKVEEQGFDELYIDSSAGAVIVAASATHIVLSRSEMRDDSGAPVLIDAPSSDVLVLDSYVYSPYDYAVSARVGTLRRIAGSSLLPPPIVLGSRGRAGGVRPEPAYIYAEDLAINSSPGLQFGLGATVRLTWSIPRPVSTLFVQFGSSRTAGRWCLDSRAFAVTSAGASGFYEGAIPRQAALLGQTMAFQVYGAHGYMSRPRIAVIN